MKPECIEKRCSYCGRPWLTRITPRGLASLWCQRYGYNASADEIQHLLDLLVAKELHDEPVRIK
jgi:hypothetical protein